MDAERLSRVFWFVAVASVLAGCVDSGTPVVGPEATQPSLKVVRDSGPGRYLVLMKDERVPSDLAARVSAAGGRVVQAIPEVGVVVVETEANNFATRIGSDKRVQAVGAEPVYLLPEVLSSPYREDVSPESNHAPTPGDVLFHLGLLWGIERVGAPDVWAYGGPYTGIGATIGIIDTGIATNHPDLANNVVFNACYTSAGQVVGRHWEPGDPCSPYPSFSFHGTHVAGTAAAQFGGGLAVGVAPNARLFNYNVFEVIPDFGLGALSSSVWQAIIHAADHDVDVLNLSLGVLTFIGNDPKLRGGADPTRQNAIALLRAVEKRVANYAIQRGTFLVTSSGNAGVSLNGNLLGLPAEVSGYLTVGGTGIRPNPRYQPGISWDVLAFYSNYGAAIDVVAPGGDCGQPDGCNPAAGPPNWFEYLILSTDVEPSPACAQVRSCPIGYAWAAGTSMASSHAAGVAALVRAVNPSLKPQQVHSRIRSTAERIGRRQLFGHGMVDAAAAVGL